MSFAVYIKREPEQVLLTDGAWTSQQSCYKQPYNFRPQLFGTITAARAKARQLGRYYTARRYDGPKPVTQWRVVGPLSATKLKWAIADASGRFLSYRPFPNRSYITRERRFKSATAAEKFIERMTMTGGAE